MAVLSSRVSARAPPRAAPTSTLKPPPTRALLPAALPRYTRGMSSAPYHVDAADPRAPSQAVWDSLTPEQRERVCAELPSEFPRSEPPEGDRHRLPKEQAEQSLRHHFQRRRRSVYLSSELPVYYPDHGMFAPDLIAVLDGDPHPREKWVVSHEQRGLDFVLEVYVSGNRKKDFELNVERYAALEIPEYFIFSPTHVGERETARLLGYRIEPGGTTYSPIVPQGGRWASEVLGLDLLLDNGRLRFAVGDAHLPDLGELVQRLDRMVNDVTEREQALLEQLNAARRQAESEAQRAERLAAQLRKLGADPEEAD